MTTYHGDVHSWINGGLHAAQNGKTNEALFNMMQMISFMWTCVGFILDNQREIMQAIQKPSAASQR